MSERDAYSINEFCERHGISRAYLYLLWNREEGPRYMQVGARRLISKEAASDWRSAMESDVVTRKLGERADVARMSNPAPTRPASPNLDSDTP